MPAWYLRVIPGEISLSQKSLYARSVMKSFFLSFSHMLRAFRGWLASVLPVVFRDFVWPIAITLPSA